MPRAKGQVVFIPTYMIVYKDTAVNYRQEQVTLRGHCCREQTLALNSFFFEGLRKPFCVFHKKNRV